MRKGIVATLLKRDDNEPFISVDIGTSAIKVMCLETTKDGRYRLTGIGTTPTPANSISNNTVSRVESVGAAIRSILEANEIKGERATFAIPGPAVFTKKITLAHTNASDLNTNIKFEAASYIPHSIDAVHLDYQVLKVHGTTSMEVLLVAVKNEIIDSYVAAIAHAGLQPAIADVDYFAVENTFELNYPEEKNKTIALVNVGARYSSVSILEDNKPLFAGDVGVGGRLYTDALCETIGMQPGDAEKAKAGAIPPGTDEHLLHETIERTTDYVAAELQRQIGFFWNAAGAERAIETIYLCGGGAQVLGLGEELSTRTGSQCLMMEPFRKVEYDGKFDNSLIEQVKFSMGVSVGLASRRFGDKPQLIN